MEIYDSARKHGIADRDIRHAVDHYFYTASIAYDEPSVRFLYLGPDRAGNLLEVITVEQDDGSEMAVHAMKMRNQFRRSLP